MGDIKLAQQAGAYEPTCLDGLTQCDQWRREFILSVPSLLPKPDILTDTEYLLRISEISGYSIAEMK